MDNIRDYVNHINVKRYVRKPIICKDGFTMSVQASSHHHCFPKIDNAEEYEDVEVGYLSKHEPLLDKYNEGYGLGDDTYVSDVYCWVPANVVFNVIIKHGGMIGGELPNLDLNNNKDNKE